MTPELAALVALQHLDSAADQARRRIGELPAAELAFEARIAAATAAVEAAAARLSENQTQRRGLDKDVAAVDARLARFEDHKAAVKTNHEYTALLHEIATAKAEKDGIEDRLLVLMEETDTLTAARKAAEAELAGTRRDVDAARATMAGERRTLEAEIARLTSARTGEARDVPPALLNKYEQLLKQRRGLAVAQMAGELCTACHVRLRPHVTQQIRRNDAIVQCESCQRILYAAAKPGEAGVDQSPIKQGSSS